MVLLLLKNKHMKNRILVLSLLAVGILAISCEEKKEEKNNGFQELYDKTMEVHNATMSKMHTIAELQGRLNTLRAQDSLNADYKTAADNLDGAYNHMMQWMRDFNMEFPYDEHPENILKGKTEEETTKIISKLHEFEKEMEQVDQEIKTGIEKAQATVK